MGPVNGGRHERVGFRAGIAEHHALVAGALVFGIFPKNALGNVRRLVVNAGKHGAGLPVKAHVRAVVAHFLYGLAGNLGQIHIAGSGDFSGYNGHAGCDQGFAGNVRIRVLFQYGIQDGV